MDAACDLDSILFPVFAVTSDVYVGPSAQILVQRVVYKESIKPLEQIIKRLDGLARRIRSLPQLTKRYMAFDVSMALRTNRTARQCFQYHLCVLRQFAAYDYHPEHLWLAMLVSYVDRSAKVRDLYTKLGHIIDAAKYAQPRRKRTPRDLSEAVNRLRKEYLSGNVIDDMAGWFLPIPSHVTERWQARRAA